MAAESNGPRSLVGVVMEGDLRASLEAIRDRLAKNLDVAEPKEAAGLAARLVEVLKALEGLPARERSSTDDLIDRRTRRLSAVPKPAGSGVKRRSGSG